MRITGLLPFWTMGSQRRLGPSHQCEDALLARPLPACGDAVGHAGGRKDGPVPAALGPRPAVQ
jgi:hypothetical protein